MTVLWLLQKRTRHAGSVDVAWTFVAGGLGMWLAYLASGYYPRKMLVIVLAGGWAMRLGTHLLRRALAHGEARRYRALRQRWGADADSRMFLLFQLEAVAAVVMALPIYAAAANATRFLNWFDLAGALLAFVAIQGEMVADRQLARYRRHLGATGAPPDGPTRDPESTPSGVPPRLRTGLWKYSRHPNYLFEWLFWWAFVLIAIGSPVWWLSAIGVVLMYLRLRRRGAFLPGAALT
jgi:steroid 5-alpha reductase family enzyme